MMVKKLELLSPAGNADIAFQAILHGADAVYMGAVSHGARKSASNSLDDIARVVDFAHQYRAKVYVTVNTLVYENEIHQVETLCRDLYRIGVDALIIQDMGILRMKIPPIELHASTQCDIRTPEKAKFFQRVGFSQIVVARELTLHEIKEIASSVTIPIECFVHGALCVSYSGRCQASFVTTGRSANRGECSQICRYPFTLKDSNNKVITQNRYLLSLKDFNVSDNLENLIDAGVSSFKIEGRLKEEGYVKNITAFYNQKINEIIEKKGGDYRRSSFGKTILKFEPVPEKSFNRGFTNYFQNSRQPLKISSLLTPKSQGEKIIKISDLNNGDGISYFDRNGIFTGVNINKIEGDRIITSRKIEIPRDIQLYRTSDVQWNKLMNSETAIRKIGVDISIDKSGVTACDERGLRVKIFLDKEPERAKTNMDYLPVFKKLGNTPYVLNKFINNLNSESFYPASFLTSKRRALTSLLDAVNRAIYPYEYRKKEDKDIKYPFEKLESSDNVANSFAERFYRDHGVKEFEYAIEVSEKETDKEKVVMTTRHCVLRELGVCRKIDNDRNFKVKYPLFLHYGNGKFRLEFDCKKCEMKVLYVEK